MKTKTLYNCVIYLSNCALNSNQISNIHRVLEITKVTIFLYGLMLIVPLKGGEGNIANLCKKRHCGLWTLPPTPPPGLISSIYIFVHSWMFHHVHIAAKGQSSCIINCIVTVQTFKAAH